MFNTVFNRARFLDADIEDWHLETWRRLLERLGGFQHSQLVTPTRDFFPPTEAKGHARAEHVFGCVKAAMGMQDWSCRLEAQPEWSAHDRIGEFHYVQSAPAPNGTFRVENGEVIISYAPELADKPWDLVATLAHELAHYLLLEHQDALDEQTHELATDLTVAYAGMGIFGANTAFQFRQYRDTFSQGWQSSGAGYLAPPSWGFALAVFGELKGAGPDIDRWLTPEIAHLTKKARGYLARRPALLEPLRSLA